MTAPRSFADEELRALTDEYSELVHSVEVLPGHHVDIVTLERAQLKVHISSQGWRVVESSDEVEQEVFETAEALLMAVSPQFCVLWNSRLTERLKGLQELGEDSESDESI